MAITIEQEPSEFTPVYNPNIFVLSSDNTAEAGFQYVVDVYFDAILQTRHLLSARPDNGLGLFDASEVMKSQVTHNIDASTGQFATNPQSYKKYQIKVGEKTTALGVVADLATSSFIFAWNSVFEFNDFVDYDEDDHLLLDGTKPFLSSGPLSRKIELNQKAWFYSMNDTPGNYDQIRVEKFDASGGSLGVLLIPNPFNTATDDNKFTRAGVGTWNINDFSVGFIDASVASYTVLAEDTGGTDISNTYTFTIDTQCRYTTIRIHFLNRLGGFDAFNFTKVADYTSSIQRRSFNNPVGDFSGSSFVYSKDQREKNIMNTTINNRLTIRSDYLTEAELAWLKECVTSPVVFQEDNLELIALNPTTTSFKESKSEYEQLFNLTIQFDFGHIDYTQQY